MSDLLERAGSGVRWHEQPSLHEEVMKYAWLDHAPLPWQIKLVWAHHHYVLGTVG